MTEEVVKKQDPLRALIAKMEPEIKNALPKIGVTVERLSRVFMTSIRKVPKLMDCTQKSLAACLIQCAELGLEPSSAMGHIYILPYGKEAQTIIGYRGMIELARRSGEVKSLNAHVVYEKDQFDFELGLEEKLVHKPSRNSIKDRGSITHAYFVAHFTNGGHHIEVLDRSEIDALRGRSKSGTSGPWKTDFAEMAKKSVVRRAFKYLPTKIVPPIVHEVIDKEDVIEAEFIAEEEAPKLESGKMEIGKTEPADEMPNFNEFKDAQKK